MAPKEATGPLAIERGLKLVRPLMRRSGTTDEAAAGRLPPSAALRLTLALALALAPFLAAALGSLVAAVAGSQSTPPAPSSTV